MSKNNRLTAAAREIAAASPGLKHTEALRIARAQHDAAPEFGTLLLRLEVPSAVRLPPPAWLHRGHAHVRTTATLGRDVFCFEPDDRVDFRMLWNRNAPDDLQWVGTNEPTAAGGRPFTEAQIKGDISAASADIVDAFAGDASIIDAYDTLYASALIAARSRTRGEQPVVISGTDPAAAITVEIRAPRGPEMLEADELDIHGPRRPLRCVHPDCDGELVDVRSGGTVIAHLIGQEEALAFEPGVSDDQVARVTRWRAVSARLDSMETTLSEQVLHAILGLPVPDGVAVPTSTERVFATVDPGDPRGMLSVVVPTVALPDDPFVVHFKDSLAPVIHSEWDETARAWRVDYSPDRDRPPVSIYPGRRPLPYRAADGEAPGVRAQRSAISDGLYERVPGYWDEVEITGTRALAAALRGERVLGAEKLATAVEAAGNPVLAAALRGERSLDGLDGSRSFVRLETVRVTVPRAVSLAGELGESARTEFVAAVRDAVLAVKLGAS